MNSQTNVKIFQMVVKIHQIITQIGGQIQRQQPVYLIDAIGRQSAFHLEFILSAEALVSVVRANFRDIGPGARKIERGEFVIQDSASKIDVDLARPWEVCFRPGQHVVMCMVFESTRDWNICCPKCKDVHPENISKDEDIEWYVLCSVHFLSIFLN